MARVQPVMRARGTPWSPHTRSAGCAEFCLVLAVLAGAVAVTGCAAGGAPAQRGSPAASAVVESSSATLDRPLTPPSSAAPPSPQQPAASEYQVRAVGPGDNGTQVTIRVGDLITVVPANSPQDWQVEEYPSRILRLLDGADPAPSHRFLAIGAGVGQLAVTAAGSGGADTFTIRVQVLRALVEGRQP